MDVKKKLVEIVCDSAQINGCIHSCNHPPCAMVSVIVDALIANDVTVQEWIPTNEPPKEPGEYIVAQKHWSDGHLETKKGKWNGVEWLVDGRESLRVAYWMPLPEPPKENNDA